MRKEDTNTVNKKKLENWKCFQCVIRCMKGNFKKKNTQTVQVQCSKNGEFDQNFGFIAMEIEQCSIDLLVCCQMVLQL